ncbi:MAG: lipid binding protein [Siphoviridae sp. ct7UA22]|nr:MAG: lipid binding protein [Siphoviridae sp. ct7UA22]
MNAALKILLMYGYAGNTETDTDVDPAPVDDIDWANMFDEPQDEEKEILDPAPVETPPADEVPEPAPQPTPEPSPEEEIKPEDPPKVEPQETPKPPVEQPKPQTQEEINAQFEAYKGALEKDFALSKEDADLIVSDPEKVFPRLMTNFYMRVMNDVYQMHQQSQNQLPQVIEQTTKAVETKTKAIDAFQSRWPDLLSTPEGQEAAAQAAVIARKRTPNASLKDIVESSGRIAYSILGKDVPQQAPAQQQANAQPAVKPKPHSPASTKGAAVKTQQLSAEEAFFASINPNDF